MRKGQLWILVSILLLVIIIITVLKPFTLSFKRNEVVADKIGKPFIELSLIDTTAAGQTIDFNQAALTIVDFWFGDCPGCLDEMKDFSRLLKKHNDSVQIVSVSINSLANWKSLFYSDLKRYHFLKTSNSNWKHYTLKSNENPRLRNDIPTDNHDFIRTHFNTHTFPVYFVINREGVVVETPASAVDYLRSL